MKSIDKIPSSKFQRASKLISTGVKVGVNYAKYYGDKIVGDDKTAKENLDKSNAEDIYDSLKTLKGSALKVAQMLSMEKNILPRAYVEKFSLSQFSVPPLSAPLVNKTFKKYFSAYPSEIFDKFSKDSVNAASIGQVHKAELNGKQLAVKVQYPGVADSISSDLTMVKPFAIKMFNLKGEGIDDYFKEVEDKLIEECDYNIEFIQSKEVVENCSHIPNIKFPNYYKEYSSQRILTMDWMEGKHISEFVKTNTNQNYSNKLGQALWDFYMYQIHVLNKVHADPHPGNFLISDEQELIAIDFGCMKVIPPEFYKPYFELADPKTQANDVVFTQKLFELEIIKEGDTAKEKEFFKNLFGEMIRLFTKPFHSEVFDFSDDDFFNQIADLGKKFAESEDIKKMNGNRGSKHFLYMNRTFFGLYNLMHDLKAKDVKINNFKNFSLKNHEVA
jgi:predicted unusual protein kinase regulating ubiquinone biosynthesis (AarF/ABC1/UbiB family)